MDNNSQELFNPRTQSYQDEEEEIGLQAIRLANAVALPMVLRSALELGVIDIICAAGDGVFLSPSEIVSQLPSKPRNPDAPALLDRMLRVLVSHSVLRCRLSQTERLYGAGPICKYYVRNGESGSVAPLFLLFHNEAFIDAWYRLKDVILEGGNAFDRAHGMPIYEYTGKNQGFNMLLNESLSKFTIIIMKKFLEVYKGFEGLKVLVDVGGGIGTNLGMVTAKYPLIKGINFDLPHVIADAPSYPGVEHVAGDMFVEVPRGDAIFMKFVLMDWRDEDCLKILKTCWKALPSHGKVIIVQTILPDEPKNDIYSEIASDVDVAMFAQCSGGKERTQKEFEALAANSGFSSCQFICRVYFCFVIELHK